MRHSFLLAVCLLPPAVAVAQATTPSKWVQDFELARSLARDQKLDLLMVFMGPAADGSDAKLDAEVFAQPLFETEAKKSFVLARFEYPKDPSTVAEVLRKQNAWLATKYRSTRLPMVWLADGQGRAYASTGHVPGGAQAFLALLETKRQAHLQAVAALEQAAKSRGIDRAKALAAGLSCLDDDIVATTYHKELLEIITLDADGSAGLKEPFDAIARDAAAKPFLVRLQDELTPLVEQKQWTDLDAKIEAARAKHQGERWAEQYLTFLQGIRKLHGDQDAAAALPLFESALAMARRSEIAPQIDRCRQEAADKHKAAEEAKKKAEEAAKGKKPPKKGR